MFFFLVPLAKVCVSRAVIEEDYSKRLARLGKMILGRDEIGYVYKFSIYSSMGRCIWPRESRKRLLPT